MSNWYASRYYILVAVVLLGLLVGLTAREILSPYHKGTTSRQLVRAQFTEPINAMDANMSDRVCADISADSHKVHWVKTSGSFSNPAVENGYVCMDYLAPNVQHEKMVTLKLTYQNHTLDLMKFLVIPEPLRPS